MNYFAFKEKMQELPYFETKELRLILGADFTPSMLVNVKNWVRKGHLIMFRRGLYAVSEAVKHISPMVFATKLYAPSYISMEMALNWYGIIPEAVFTVTSVTTRKTKTFTTPQGIFSYQKIKKDAFGGYETRSVEAFSFNMAVPEKAIVDFFYLNRNIMDGSEAQFRSYRFNEDFRFNAKKMLSFANAFRNKKTVFLTHKFIQYYVAK
jgi:predicted transcriptional regulator of viral defense system